jgi:hypothetical protein
VEEEGMGEETGGRGMEGRGTCGRSMRREKEEEKVAEEDGLRKRSKDGFGKEVEKQEVEEFGKSE